MKEILGAIEFADNEVRLIIGEFFKTRFNIIRVETQPYSEDEGDSTFTSKAAKKAAEEVIERAQTSIGADIIRLILVVPSVGFKRYPLKVNVRCGNGVVSKEDVNRALRKSMRTKVDNNITIVNAVCIKYTCNGISSRRIPERELADELIVDIDLLCADKALIFDHVSILESIGIEVLDISLDMYAICKEAVLFEQTVNQNLILIKADNDTTTLALLSKGKLYNVEILYEGLRSIYKTIAERLDLPMSVVERLVKYDTKVTDTEHIGDVIYAYNDVDGTSKTLTQDVLTDMVYPEVHKLATAVKQACDPILESGLVSIVIVGEGADLKMLVEEIGNISGVTTKVYCPETIGARDPNYCTLLGALYGYRDLNELKDRKLSCIDLYKFTELIEKREDSQTESLTTKIRNLFQLKDRGGETHE